MKNQLLKILQYYKLSSTRLAEQLGVQPSGISHILSGRNKPSFDFIQKLIEEYPEIDSNWLITGKGSMIKKEPVQQAISSPKPTEPNLFSQIQEKSGQTDHSEKIKAPMPELDAIKNGIEGDVEQIVIFFTDGSFKSYKNRF